MIKAWRKERILKILTAIVISFSIFAILPEQSAMAQDPVTNDVEEATTADAEETPTGAEGEEAADPTVPETAGAEGDQQQVTEGMRNQINLIITIQRMANHVLFPILMLTGGLLDNSLLFGGGMEEVLRSIWIPMRNLVNILFVLILVGIALYNVLGIGDENSQYAIKTILPKLVIGIIAVNFSFFGIKVILDGVNVLTVSIFSLPNQVSEGLGRPADERETNMAFCAMELGLPIEKYRGLSEDGIIERREDIIYQRLLEGAQVEGRMERFNRAARQNLWNEHVQAMPDMTPEAAQNAKEEQDKMFLCDKDGTLRPQGQLFLGDWGYNNAALLMALNMGGIQFFSIPTDMSLDSIIDLMINLVLSMVMYLAYVVSFIALFVVLLARIVTLWVCIALSPMLILIMASSGLKEKMGGSISKLSEIFTKSVIAPVMIAIPMTIGWIMLNAIKNATTFMAEDGLNRASMMGIPIAGMNDLQQLMVGVGTIAVVWMGVFAAAEGTAAQGMTNWIKSNAERAGKYIAAAPLRHMPIIPVKGERKTLGTLIREGQRKIADPLQVQKEGESLEDFRRVRDLGGFATVLHGTRGRDINEVTRAMGNMQNSAEIRRLIPGERQADFDTLMDNTKDRTEREAARTQLIRATESERTAPTGGAGATAASAAGTEPVPHGERTLRFRTEGRRSYDANVTASRGAQTQEKARESLRVLGGSTDSENNLVIRTNGSDDEIKKDLQAVLGSEYDRILNLFGDERALIAAARGSGPSPT